jgi:hypothetical protein
MRAPNSRTEASPARWVASLPSSTSAMPPWAALVANLLLSFADEQARINRGVATNIGAAKLRIFRHIHPSFSQGNNVEGLFRFGTGGNLKSLANRTQTHDPTAQD